jgi:hypothetical protein
VAAFVRLLIIFFERKLLRVGGSSRYDVISSKFFWWMDEWMTEISNDSISRHQNDICSGQHDGAIEHWTLGPMLLYWEVLFVRLSPRITEQQISTGL